MHHWVVVSIKAWIDESEGYDASKEMATLRVMTSVDF